MAIMHKSRFFAKKKIISEKIGKAHRGRVGRWRTGRGRVVRSGFVGSLQHSGATWCWCLVSRPLWCTRCHQRSPRCSWLLPGQHQTGTSSGDGRRGGARLGPPAQRQAAAAPRDLGGGRGGRGGGGLESSWQQQRWHWLSTFSCNHRWARWAAQDRSFFILSLFPSDPITTNNNIDGSSWSGLESKVDFDDCEHFLRKYPKEARDSSGRYQETFDNWNWQLL